ncbi:HNH endonuclease [Lysinibacillus odysseyi]|uniref:HNH nuclease domain-containing protein n=1 Tax=Lysinibacillus odysseyi 34hs-1 = NBRC 100172 TaxID=1220589 RepID=A0A0A3IWY7_9BACI|nr:HNH endonuclease [Lysinibacillus odysseyi]KGR87413.1 hypothetical protein CD32_03710 [Lysinibacillus odysseyi 34hs-1 = NBRC 100172]
MESSNPYRITHLNGKEYIEFSTVGKYKLEVIVDKSSWENYLHKFRWTITFPSNRKYASVKTSVNKHSVRLHRMIIENEYSELDYWGNTVDHINNNPLDNRLENLRIYNSKLNSTNILSKNIEQDLHLIFPQKSIVNGVERIYGYKVHKNVFDLTIYKNFETLEAAKKYRNEVVIPLVNEKIEEMKKKTRDIEFERGLRDKLNNNELEEVLAILNKYNILYHS